MAKYTMELRRIVDIFGRDEVESWFSSYNLADFLTPEQIAQINKYNVWSKEKLAKQKEAEKAKAKAAAQKAKEKEKLAAQKAKEKEAAKKAKSEEKAA